MMDAALIFTLENKPYAIDLAFVKKVFLAVEITSIPHAKSPIAGEISIHGQVVNVINMREVLNFKPRELDVNDHFIYCKTSKDAYVLWVDKVSKVKSCTQEDLTVKSTHSVLKNEEPMTLLFDLEKLLEPSCRNS